MDRVRVLVLLSIAAVARARTLDGGRNDVHVFKPHPPMAPPRLPLLKAGSDVSLGLNDIQGGLEDKVEYDDLIVEVEPSTTPAPPPPPPPPVTETNAIEAVEDLVAEAVEEIAEEEEEFDEDIFQGEEDLVVIIRRMYESLDKRLSSLRSRVSRVEQTTGDVLARLTVLDCADLQVRGRQSGTYTFHMDHNGKRPVTVFCDMDTDGGGWTVIQRRLPHSKAVNFNRGWHDYKVGFGNASSDYWIGLENMYVWTNTRHYELRIVLSDFDGESAFAQYDNFYIENEDHAYRIHLSGYSGTAGDAMTNEGKSDNFTADGMMFSTHDEDHDTSHEINCAKYWKIGGWWFNRCSWANLNGPYKEPGDGDGIGINWHMWRNKQYLRSSTMMIRPAKNH
nr:techylectin-5A-like [Penaeus vannamei]